VSARRILVPGVAAFVLAACVGASTGDAATVPSDDDSLASLRQQAHQLLPGGANAFRARLAALRGHAVGRVAFLRVDSKDGAGAARSFLKRHPVPYPHYDDPDGSVARVFRGGRAFPTTGYYNAAGTLVATHPGAYADEAKLDADIRRYALNG
jgi:hypothetical protein